MPTSARGIEPKGGPRKTGMQPAMKISLVRRADAESPGSTRQKSVLLMRSTTCVHKCLHELLNFFIVLETLLEARIRHLS